MRARIYLVRAAAIALFSASATIGSAGAFDEGESGAAVLAEYKTRAAQARDAESHVKLALWCERQGLVAEREKQLVLAVLANGDATARGLLGLVGDGRSFRRPSAVTQRILADETLSRTLAEYESRRSDGDTAEDHWRLALWCEKHGLDAEAKAHLAAALRRDPKREAIWKKLGYRKREGRWVTDAQLAAEKAEAEAQRKANLRWGRFFEKTKARLAVKSRREAAEATLADITDPRACPMIWKFFVNDGAASELDQTRAVQMFGQIDAPQASRALVALAVFGRSSSVRNASISTLRRRDPREFLDLPISMLRPPIKFEVRPGGPNAAGTLFVEGREFNVQTLYRMPQLTEPLGIDAFGMPVLYSADDVRNFNLLNNLYFPDSGSSTVSSRTGSQVASTSAGLQISAMSMIQYQRMVELRTQLMLQTARRLAMEVERKLVRDVAALQAYNQAADESNERIAAILSSLTGQDLGKNPDAWRTWWADRQGYVYQPDGDKPGKPRIKPTIETQTPLLLVGPEPPVFHAACFAPGTLVQTRKGPLPIKSLAVGDMVLSQDTTTGALGYQPVIAVHHNPPSPTFRLKTAKSEPIETTGIHRFWVAGRGWIMARDLKIGDPIRVLGGVSRVEELEPTGKVEPVVYNLDIASNRDFFVGRIGLLAHDNSLPLPDARRFDAP